VGAREGGAENTHTQNSPPPPPSPAARTHVSLQMCGYGCWVLRVQVGHLLEGYGVPDEGAGGVGVGLGLGWGRPVGVGGWGWDRPVGVWV